MKGKIFNAQEVQSILNRSKVMFREVIKVQPTSENQVFGTIVCSSDKDEIGKHHFINSNNTSDRTENFKCPYQVGQKIFCKESWKEIVGGLIYKADYEDGDKFKCWKPAQHMKQEHSRLTLQIKSIGVERLQELSFGDALREGISDVFEGSYDGEMLLEKFKSEWSATHKKPEEKFEASPWVWKVQMEVVK